MEELKKPETGLEMLELCAKLGVKVYDFGRQRLFDKGEEYFAYVTGFRWRCRICNERVETVSKAEEKAMHFELKRSDIQTEEAAAEFGMAWRLERDSKHFAFMTLGRVKDHKCDIVIDGTPEHKKLLAWMKSKRVVMVDAGCQQTETKDGALKNYYVTFFEWGCRLCGDKLMSISRVSEKEARESGDEVIYRFGQDCKHLKGEVMTQVNDHVCKYEGS